MVRYYHILITPCPGIVSVEKLIEVSPAKPRLEMLLLILTGHGREWVDNGVIMGRGGEWVKVVQKVIVPSDDDDQRHYSIASNEGARANKNPSVSSSERALVLRYRDWHHPYSAMRQALGAEFPTGYVSHEAAEWIDEAERWLFFPRKVSANTPYADDTDEVRS